MTGKIKIYEISGGEIELWSVPYSSLMMKINSKSTDPIELGEGEVEELISVLTLLLSEIK